MSSPDFPPIDVTDLPARTAAAVLQIDQQCRLMAACRIRDGLTAAEHRAAAESYTASGSSDWLIGMNQTAARLLDMDARLLVLLDLQVRDRVHDQFRRYTDLCLYDELVREACGMQSASPSLELERQAFRSAQVLAARQQVAA